MRDDRIEALPNLLTLLRLPLAAAIWIAPGSPAWALSVLGLAGLSDITDGWLARTLRRRKWETEGDPSAWAAGTGRGAWLDPVCDKIFVASVLVAVWVTYRPEPWIIAALTTRQVLLALAWLVAVVVDPGWRRRRITLSARWPGKITTVMEFVTIGLVVAALPGVEPAAVATAGLGAFAAGHYVWLVGRQGERT